MLDSPRAQGHPTEAQHGAGESERERERKKRNKPRTHNARGGKRNDTTKTKNTNKGATKARKETGAHGIGSETNMGTPTPQREETNRPTAPPQARAHPAQASKAMREREKESREEREKGTNEPQKQCYTRTPKKPGKCIPGYPQHTNHAGTN